MLYAGRKWVGGLAPVEHRYLMACLKESLRQMAAYKNGAAQNKNFHGAPSL
jgi:hypothetical protein